MQGVGFRYSARHEAEKLDLAGLARNEEDESVYIEAEGDEDNLKAFLDWCKQGPWFAKVDRIKEDWSDNLKEYSSFEIS